jgi:NADH:ubiquinone reductase (non-electrogenic)
MAADRSPLPARPRLIILGTGFGAFNVVKHLGTAFEVTVVSPRNHFLFTPLLPSTTVGTIEFRSIIEPIRHARRGLRFYHATADALDPARRVVRCTGIGDRASFELPYDILVIAVGAVSNTFHVPGVAEHALFLKDVQDARALRQRVIRCFEQANLPTATPEERQRLLHFVVCGGGPTGVEFAAELHDFLFEDLLRVYAPLVAEARITIVEAMKEILGGFDESLRRYATDIFRRREIAILTEAPVVRVEAERLHLANGTSLPFGLLLWSTGNGPTPFAVAAPLQKDGRQRIQVDTSFRAAGVENIFAIGDCAVVVDNPLPATAQVAQQQGKYLGRALGLRARGRVPEPFSYKHLGMLAYIGGNRALADLDTFKGRGWATWLFWRSAYLTRIVSLKNKVMVLFDWVKARVFGRDISQF